MNKDYPIAMAKGGKTMIESFKKLGSARLLRGVALISLMTATGLVAGCNKQPEGQVVAVVNGEEITLQELNAEMGGAQAAEGADAQDVRNRALNNIISRRLLSEVAEEEQIASSPEYIIRRRQMEDALLVQMLSQKIARELDEPTAAELEAFIAENPQMFARRTIFALDQIRFQPPTRDDYLEQLAATQTMADVVAVLNRLGIQFQRGNARVDSASVPTNMFNQIVQVGSSEPFVVPAPGMVTVSHVLASQAAPIAGEQAQTVATNALRQRTVATELEERLEAAKAEAGIDYQPDFGPPPEASPAIAPTGAPTPAPTSTSTPAG